MIRTVTCVVVGCDRCDKVGGFDDEDWGGELHYASVAAAAAALPGWRVDAAGEVVCGECVIEEVCATHGHDFEDWRACGCGGKLPPHKAAAVANAALTGVCPVRVRWCQRDRYTLEEEFPGDPAVRRDIALLPRFCEYLPPVVPPDPEGLPPRCSADVEPEEVTDEQRSATT